MPPLDRPKFLGGDTGGIPRKSGFYEGAMSFADSVEEYLKEKARRLKENVEKGEYGQILGDVVDAITPDNPIWETVQRSARAAQNINEGKPLVDPQQNMREANDQLLGALSIPPEKFHEAQTVGDWPYIAGQAATSALLNSWMAEGLPKRAPKWEVLPAEEQAASRGLLGAGERRALPEPQRALPPSPQVPATTAVDELRAQAVPEGLSKIAGGIVGQAPSTITPGEQTGRVAQFGPYRDELQQQANELGYTHSGVRPEVGVPVVHNPQHGGFQTHVRGNEYWITHPELPQPIGPFSNDMAAFDWTLEAQDTPTFRSQLDPSAPDYLPPTGRPDVQLQRLMDSVPKYQGLGELPDPSPESLIDPRSVQQPEAPIPDEELDKLLPPPNNVVNMPIRPQTITQGEPPDPYVDNSPYEQPIPDEELDKLIPRPAISGVDQPIPPQTGQMELPWSRGDDGIDRNTGFYGSSSLEDIPKLRAQQILGENWGETRQPEQLSMADDLGDSIISQYLGGEDATPPEMQDLSNYGPDKLTPSGGAEVKIPEVLPAESELDEWGFPKDRDLTPEEVEQFKRAVLARESQYFGPDSVENQRTADDIMGVIPITSEETKSIINEIMEANAKGYSVYPPGYQGPTAHLKVVGRLSDGSYVVDSKARREELEPPKVEPSKSDELSWHEMSPGQLATKYALLKYKMDNGTISELEAKELKEILQLIVDNPEIKDTAIGEVRAAGDKGIGLHRKPNWRWDEGDPIPENPNDPKWDNFHEQNPNHVTPYRLPDGTIINIRTEVARGQRTIDFGTKEGKLIKATRVEEEFKPDWNSLSTQEKIEQAVADYKRKKVEGGFRKPGDPNVVLIPELGFTELDAEDLRAVRYNKARIAKMPKGGDFSEKFLKTFPEYKGQFSHITGWNEGAVSVELKDGRGMSVDRDAITGVKIPAGRDYNGPDGLKEYHQTVMNPERFDRDGNFVGDAGMSPESLARYKEQNAKIAEALKIAKERKVTYLSLKETLGREPTAKEMDDALDKIKKMKEKLDDVFKRLNGEKGE